MDMEMSSGVARAAPPKLQEEDPAAAVAGSWQPARRRRLMLVAGVMALLLLAFFVLGQESASTVWEIASAKLTAMNNGGARGGRGGFMDYASRHGHAGAAGNATEGKADELLGGLLAPGMDRRSCRSRYESWRYFKHFPYAPSPHLLRALRAYEARHRRCAPGTPLYAEAVEQLRSGRSGSAAAECRYVVWLPFDGLGNRMLSMASGFLYALLTGRVFLVALPPDSADLFCEPFPGTTWLLPHQDFPVANVFYLGVSPEAGYTNLLNNKKITAAVDNDDDTAASNATTAVPAYVYLSLGWQLTDRLFFCGEHQRAIGKVDWLLLFSDLYFAPSLYAVTTEFRDELRRLFPEKEATSHLLLRYLLHPSNPVWGLVTRYYHSYLAAATRRIGVQIRMFGFASIPVDDMYNQILSCSRQERILPETVDDDGESAAAAAEADTGSKTTTTAILVASLYADYYERLRSRYYEHASTASASGKGGGGGGVRWVGVFQPTHEEQQATENLAHNQKALAEVYLLSFSEELVTSGISTFGYVSSSLAGVRPTILLTAHGHKVPDPPCRRAVSMEPCNLTPPARMGVECRAAKQAGEEEDDLARHVRACEDADYGVKFFD